MQVKICEKEASLWTVDKGTECPNCGSRLMTVEVKKDQIEHLLNIEEPKKAVSFAHRGDLSTHEAGGDP